jgi:site-specific DNA-cytosine methylase
MLELFSGTCSVGKVASAMGWEVISLDRDLLPEASLREDLAANIQTDKMEWDHKTYPSGYFQFIWASPPCTEYSRAKTVGIRKLDDADTIVKKAWEIIDYFNPPLGYVLENPQTGLLKAREFMLERSFTDIDYCKYGMPYRKRTRLWNNVYGWVPKSLCKRDCDSFENGKHKEHAQRGPSGKKETWNNQIKHKQTELYVIPSELLIHLFSFVSPLLKHPPNRNLDQSCVFFSEVVL